MDEDKPLTRNLKQRKRSPSYKSESLTSALAAIKLGKLNLSEASSKYKIPKSTLCSRLKRDKLSDKCGTPPLLSSAEEDKLAEWLQYRYSMGSIVGWPELSLATKDLLEENKLSFKQMTTGWLSRFKKRRPNIPVLKTKREFWYAPSLFSQDIMDEWMINLHNHCQSNNSAMITDLLTTGSRRLFCLGSLKISSSEYGIKSSDRTSCQLIASYNSIGEHTKPFLMCKNKQLFDNIHIFDIFSVQSFVQKEDYFSIWFTHFLNHINDLGIAKPVILLFDRSITHISMSIVQIAKNNGVILCYFPLHSECHQPPEVGLFGSMRESISSFKTDATNNWSTCLTLLANVWQKHATPYVAAKSFEDCGLIPLANRYKAILQKLVCNSAPSLQMDNNNAAQSFKLDTVNIERVAAVQMDTVNVEQATTSASMQIDKVNLENLNKDVITGMEIALKVVEEKCMENQYLPLYETFYRNGTSPVGDPMFKVWKVLMQSIDKAKQAVNREKSSGTKKVNSFSSLDSNIYSVSAVEAESISNPIEINETTNNKIDSASIFVVDDIDIDTRVSLNTPNVDSFPISNRYRREFNFDAKPYLNIEQHHLEILEQYQATLGNIELQQLHIDIDADFCID